MWRLQYSLHGSNQTKMLEKADSYDFPTVYELIQIVYKPTRIADTMGHYAKLIDPLSHILPWKILYWSVIVHLATSDHLLIIVKLKTSIDATHFMRRCFRTPKLTVIVSDLTFRKLLQLSSKIELPKRPLSFPNGKVLSHRKTKAK